MKRFLEMRGERYMGNKTYSLRYLPLFEQDPDVPGVYKCVGCRITEKTTAISDFQKKTGMLWKVT